MIPNIRPIISIVLIAVCALAAGCGSCPMHSGPSKTASANAPGKQLGTPAEKQPATVAEKPLEVIDAHTHPDFGGQNEPTSGIPETRDEYVKEMREAGVVGAIAMGARGVRNEPDLHTLGVMRCAGIASTVDVAAIEKGLKSGHYGCIKIYLGYIHQYASDHRYEPAYHLAEKYAVPVVFHTGDTYSIRGKLKFSDPLTIDEVAVDHPKINFVIAHCGNPWFASAAEVAYKNPNVNLECSALLIGDFSKKPTETIQKTMVEPIRWIFDYVEDPSKIMFGTDWPLVRMKDYLDAFKLAIPKEHWQAVFHDNAVRIYKMKGVLDQRRPDPTNGPK